jgi:hypothetical protein
MKDLTQNSLLKIDNLNYEIIKKSIKLIEEGNKISDDEFYNTIAALASMYGFNVYLTKYIPKGKLFIGIGENLLQQKEIKLK